MSAVPARDVLDRLVGFGRFLRANGMAVGTGRILTFTRAAAALDPFDRDQLHAAARAALVSRPEDFAKLDLLFDRYFGLGLEPAIEAEPGGPPQGQKRTADGATQEETVVQSAASWSPAAGDDAESEERTAIRLVASPTEVLRKKDFAKLTPQERAAMLRDVRRLVMEAP